MLAGLGPDFLSSESSDLSRLKPGGPASRHFAAPHTQFREGLWQRSPTTIRSTPIPAGILLSPQKCLSRVRYKAEIGRTAGNKRPARRVGHDSGERRFQPTF